MDIQIGTPNNIWLLAVVGTGIVVTAYASLARRRAAMKFATARLRSQILPPGTRSRHWISATLIAASMSLLCLGLMDIRWGKIWREVPQKGIEVMFVLDVSRSMLAEDVTPNRLSRAKQQIKDMVDEMAGDRVGLIVFAGDTRQSVPLTTHYEDFKQTLDAVGPHTVRVGGSRLGDALKAAANGFISKTNDHRAIVVFTDGEDQESKPDEVAKQIHAEKGIRIFTVGLGDINQGALIPETEDRRGGFVRYEGQQVWSKMNGQILSQIATDTDGAYIPAGTRNVNMSAIYHGYVANVGQAEFETAKINAYIARYQWFAAPALALLLLEVWSSTRRRRDVVLGRIERSAVPTSGTSAGTALRSVRATTTSYITAAVIALSAAPASAQSPLDNWQTASEINAANTLLRNGRIDEAIDAYRKVVPSEQQRDELNYNLAVAEYRKGNIEAAEQLFADIAGTSSPTIAADSRYNLGNCQYSKALVAAEKDKPTAIELLRKAIANYRGALRGKPNNPDARANIELAGELIRKLEQEQKKEEEQKKQDKQQKQDQQDKDQQQDQKDQSDQRKSDQQKQDEQKQQDKSQDSESQKSDSQKDESQKNSDQKKNDEQMDEEQPKQDQQSAADQSKNDEQKRDEQKTDKTGDKEQKNDQQQQSEQQSQPKSPDSKQKQQQKLQQQSGDQQEQNDEGKPEEQDAKNQPVPTGDLKAASKQEQNKQPEGTVGMTDSNAKDGLMTREEALKMLQSVRDRDLLRRMQQLRQERSRHKPVDKDW